MSTYTTGELAKLCNVTVRTVQYYDNRNILTPSQLTEGGRRLYSEEDLKKMRVICFLRDLGLSLNAIAQLLTEEHPEAVIDLLLEQQTNLLQGEIQQRQEQLEKVRLLQQERKSYAQFSVETISDIAYRMKCKNKLRRVRAIMLGVGIPLEILEWASLVYAIRTGSWWLFILGLCLVIGGSVWISWYYYRSVKYICPQCHTIFKPRFKEMFWANHTPNTRKLTCPHCSHKGFCVEVYGGDEV